VYDQALKEIFISDPNFNAVEVYSAVNGQKVGSVPIPGPAGLGFSPDFSKLYVGTITAYMYIVDPVALHVTSQIQIPYSVLTINQGGTGSTLMPVMPYAMADGSIIIGLGATSQSSNQAVLVGVGKLVRYVPGNGSFTSIDPIPGGVSSNPSRSQDGKLLLVYGSGLRIYSVGAQGYLPTSVTLQNFAAFLAANADGSQFATVQSTSASSSQVNFWGSNLQQQPQTYTINGPVTCALYSRDGKFLYLMTDLNYLAALDTQSGMPVAYIGLAVGGFPFPTTLFDVDETYHLFGVENGGAFVLNASAGQSSPPSAIPDFSGLPSTEANPNVGPLSGGTHVQFIPAPTGGGSADGIANSMEAYFGSIAGTQDVVGPYPSSSDGENFLTSTTPAATSPGPVSVVLTDANNNTVLLPDAFTYGPHILRVIPNTASAAGGDQVTIYAYGLGFFDLSDVHVTIGGVNISPATLNSYASNDYPEQSVTLHVPAGTPGWADVVVTTSNGSDTLKRGLQYLNEQASVAGGPFGFAVYDQVRDVFYLTGDGSTVSVFNPNTKTLGQQLTSTSISTGAVLGQETLTPDGSKLLVNDPTDQSVIVFDLVGGTSTAVKVLLSTDPTTTQILPVTILTTAGNRAFVSVTPCETYPLREIDLTNLTVQPRADMASTCPTYLTYPEYGAASEDGSKVVYAGNSGQEFGLEPPGAEYVWSYDAASDMFSGPVTITDTPWVGEFTSLNANGGVVALPQGVLDQRMLPLVPILEPGFDVRLNETGAMIIYLTKVGLHGQIFSWTPTTPWASV
jgi:hypothetical protein